MKSISQRDPYGYGVLIEQVIHQNTILIEAIGDMREKVNRIPFIEAMVLDHDKRIKNIERVVTETNRELRATNRRVDNHETRITKLEEV